MKTMKNTMKCLVAMFIMAMAFVTTGITAEAYGLTQTAQDQTSVAVSWTAEEDVVSYYVGLGTDSTTARAAAETMTVPVAAGTTSYIFTGLQPGTEYYAYILYTYKSYDGTIDSSIAGSGSIVTLPTKVTGLNQTKWWYFIESVDFAWDDQTAANYEVVVTDHKDKVVYTDETSSNQSGYNDVKNNKMYKAKVRAYVDINGQRFYGDYSDEAYLFTQPMLKKASISGGKLKITWGKISGVTGYDVYVSTKEKKGYKKVKSLKKSKNSLTISKVKGKKFNAKKKYFVYIVAKKKVNGITYTSGRHYTNTVKNGSTSVNWTFD